MKYVGIKVGYSKTPKIYMVKSHIVNDKGGTIETYFAPDYSKKKKKWDWEETVICSKRTKTAKEISVMEMVDILNGGVQ